VRVKSDLWSCSGSDFTPINFQPITYVVFLVHCVCLTFSVKLSQTVSPSHSAPFQLCCKCEFHNGI
jgi:hypothetical protein